MFSAIYLTGIVICGIVLLTSEVEEDGQHDRTSLLFCALCALFWPIFLMGLIYDAYRLWKARTADHDKDRY